MILYNAIHLETRTSALALRPSNQIILSYPLLIACWERERERAPLFPFMPRPMSPKQWPAGPKAHQPKQNPLLVHSRCHQPPPPFPPFSRAKPFHFAKRDIFREPTPQPELDVGCSYIPGTGTADLASRDVQDTATPAVMRIDVTRVFVRYTVTIPWRRASTSSCLQSLPSITKFWEPIPRFFQKVEESEPLPETIFLGRQNHGSWKETVGGVEGKASANGQEEGGDRVAFSMLSAPD